MAKPELPIRVRLAVGWAWLSLLWEGVLRLLFPAILFPALFVGLALTGLFGALGDPVRLISLLAAAAGFVWFVRRGCAGFQWPTLRHAERRAELDAQLPAGLLDGLRDQPVQDGTHAGVLWASHQDRSHKLAQRAQIQKPRAIWSALDQAGLRAGILVLLTVGLVWSGDGAWIRLQAALAPIWLSEGRKQAKVEAWLDAPDYAQLPPRYLGVGVGGDVKALPGSTLVVRVSDSPFQPVLRVPGNKKRMKLPKLGPGVYEVRAQLLAPGRVQLYRGAQAQWNFTPQKDADPVIAFTEPPDVTEQGELHVQYRASDDFGVEKVRLLLETNAPGYFAKQAQVDIPVQSGREVDQHADLDLQQNILAGLPVTLRLQAEDGAGHVAVSAPVSMTLPEKLFIDPWAKAFAEQRLLILRDDRPYSAPNPPADPAQTIWVGMAKLSTESSLARLKRAPAGIARAAHLQMALMRAPAQGVREPMVWLGLSYVNARLRDARTRDDLSGLDADLWQLALHAEGGELASAEAAMKLAEKALQTGLLLGEAPTELKRLSDAYEKSVQRYLQALAQQALKSGAQGEGGGGGTNLSGDQLQEMLQALQDLSATGARGDARSLLQALSQLLANMRLQLVNGGQGGNGDDPVSQAMRKALEDLSDLMGSQRELLDKAQQKENAQATAPGKTPDNDGSSGKAPTDKELQEMQKKLSDTLRQYRKDPAVQGSEAAQELDSAAQAMDRAADNFGAGKDKAAMREGGQAMGELRKGAQGLANALLQHQQGQNAKNRDPFGRRADGSVGGEDGMVPDTVSPEQARKILRELRERAADPNRPRAEREYLQRLLERF